MSSTVATNHQRGARLPRAYLAAWAGAATLSAAYLTAAALVPAEQGRQQVASAVEVTAAIEAAEARTIRLKATLEDFQRDLALVRTGPDGRSLDKGLEARLAALEERLSIETGLAVAKVEQASRPMSADATPPAADLPPAKPSGPRVAGAIATVSDGQTRISIPLETGSVEKAPSKPDATEKIAPAQPLLLNAGPAPTSAPAPGPGSATAPAAAPQPGFAAVVTPAPPPQPPKPYAVQLASGASVDSLRSVWSLLSEQHRDAFRGLQPRYAQTPTTPEAGPIFDLLAGPYKSAAEAKKACKLLAARGLDCKVANFGGETL